MAKVTDESIDLNLNCRHNKYFHEECILDSINKGYNACPLCRTKIIEK